VTANASVAVTVSIGIAPMADLIDKGLEHVINRADEALYEAKRMGRNRIMPSIAVRQTALSHQ
jgi:diguanylate cyclase (GGDEF)-like protein